MRRSQGWGEDFPLDVGANLWLSLGLTALQMPDREPTAFVEITEQAAASMRGVK